MKKIALATAVAALLGAAGYLAVAQEAPRNNDPAAAETLRAALKERALTRPRADATQVGQPAEEVVDGRINWTGMRTSLAISAGREVAAQQNIRATGRRPPGVRAAAPESFENVVVREVNLTRLPVLAPEGARIRQTLRVYSLGDSYSATAEVDDGVAMRISGARRKIVVGDQASARTRIKAMRAEQKTLPSLETPYLISRSESSTDLSFAKFGAGYVLSLMCDDPADTRCSDDAFIVGLASDMSLLNPEAGGE